MHHQSMLAANTCSTVDHNAYLELKRTIGNLVADGTLGKYILHSLGVEGGEHSCIEIAPWLADNSLSDIRTALEEIHPNPQTTAYSLTPKETCGL